MLAITWTLLLAIAPAVYSSATPQMNRFVHKLSSDRSSPARIRPNPCMNSKGHRGRCMFVWDCVKTNGTHLGTCVDGFLFGTCCGERVDDYVDVATIQWPQTANYAGHVETRNPPSTQSPHENQMQLQHTTIHIKIQNITNNITTATTLSNKKPTKTPQLTGMKVPSKIFKDCGIPSHIPHMRIVGGADSKLGDWPWQISVRRTAFFGLSSTHRCGGAILNEIFVATAGHCVADLNLHQIRVRAGEYDLSDNSETYPHIERGVQRRFLHPKYNSATYEYDLALVRLDKALNPAPNIFPICLPESDDNEAVIGEVATITGWGRLNEGGRLPSVLQQVRVPVIDNVECEKMFKAAGRKEKIQDMFICAGYKTGGKDSCQGDSGGPLQMKSEDGRWVLTGIISWGVGCAQPNLPGVCTRVSKFKQWIVETVATENN